MKVQADQSQSGQDIQALALAVKEASLTHLLEECILQQVGQCLSKAQRPGQTSEAADLVQVLQEALQSVTTQFPGAVRVALQEWQAHTMVASGDLEASLKKGELEEHNVENTTDIEAVSKRIYYGKMVYGFWCSC